MKINKAYVFRMYPTSEQQELLEKSFGVARYIYNYYLNESINNYKETKEPINAYKMIKTLPNLQKQYSWLKEVDSTLLRTSIFDLEDAYKRFFKMGNGYPKFKSKQRSRLSYRTSNMVSKYKGKEYHSIELNLNNKTIKLPKLKEVKIRGYRNMTNFLGRIINATIYKEANKYYVSLCVQEEKLVSPFKLNRAVGIDVGIKDLAVTSDGLVFTNEKIIKKYEKKIKGFQKALSRAKSGSKNRYKLVLKLKRVYQKLKNARKYTLHYLSKKIVEENDLIVIEKLDIQKMMKNHHLAKSISDVSWYEFFLATQI